MSEQAKSGSRRRRGFRKPKNATSGGADKSESKEERKPRIPAEHVPVPASMIGKSCIGRVNTLFYKGKVPYGWIYIDGGNAEMPVAETPRVYFSFKNFSDETYSPKKGFQVQFDIAEDETKRAYATNIKLTATGLKQAEEHKAAQEARKAAEAIAAASKPKADSAAKESEPKVKRERKPRARRPPVETRPVTLKVTCEGKTEVKEITATIGRSLGVLKHVAVGAFEVPVTYQVFHNGELLNKTVFSSMVDGATIHLKEGSPATA